MKSYIKKTTARGRHLSGMSLLERDKKRYAKNSLTEAASLLFLADQDSV